MASIKVLLAGESWVSNSTHYKGWDFFSNNDQFWIAISKYQHNLAIGDPGNYPAFCNCH